MGHVAAPLVVIIHGAVARETTFLWMEELRGHLLRHGVERVDLFPWSGRIGRSSLDLAGARLANYLKKLATPDPTLSREDPLPVRIFAKSTGALVVRNAVRLLLAGYPKCRLELLVQVAAPNPPETEDSLRAFTRVVNIYSEDDAFLRFFIRVGPFWRHRQRLETAVTQVSNLHVAGVTHHVFNTNALIKRGELTGTHLFDLYCRLLTAPDSTQDVHSKP